MSSTDIRALLAAARLIEQADGLIVTAGAGMSAQSGLPYFRGPVGFMKAHPALGARNITLDMIQAPRCFRRNPALAWGYQGLRLREYREVPPHAGYAALLQIGARLAQGVFAVTTNVDGHFLAAGFPASRVYELFGSAHYLQCLRGCTGNVWPAASFRPQVDEAQCRLLNALPRCPHCGELARPNILMCSDADWIDTRCDEQARAFWQWRKQVRRPVVLELGVGTRVRALRRFAERQQCPLIRVNPRGCAVEGERDISLKLKAFDAIDGILAGLESRAVPFRP